MYYKLVSQILEFVKYKITISKLEQKGRCRFIYYHTLDSSTVQYSQFIYSDNTLNSSTGKQYLRFIYWQYSRFIYKKTILSIHLLTVLPIHLLVNNTFNSSMYLLTLLNKVLQVLFRELTFALQYSRIKIVHFFAYFKESTLKI